MIFGNLQKSSGCPSTIFGNLRKSSGDFWTSSATFKNRRINFGNLQKCSGDLRRSSVIFGRLRVNVGYFRNTSDDLRMYLGFPRFPRTNFGNLRCNLHWCYTSTALLLANQNRVIFSLFYYFNKRMLFIFISFLNQKKLVFRYNFVIPGSISFHVSLERIAKQLLYSAYNHLCG